MTDERQALGYPEALLDPILHTGCIPSKDLTGEQLAIVSHLLKEVYPYMFVVGDSVKGKPGGTSNGMLVNYEKPDGATVVRALFPAHLIDNWRGPPALHAPIGVRRPNGTLIQLSSVSDYNAGHDMAVAQVTSELAEEFKDQCPPLFTGNIPPDQEIYVVSSRWDGEQSRPVVCSAKIGVMPPEGFREAPMDPAVLVNYGVLEVGHFLTLPGAGEVPRVGLGYSGSVVVTKDSATGKWAVVGLLHGAPQGKSEPLVYTRAHQMLQIFQPTGGIYTS